MLVTFSGSLLSEPQFPHLSNEGAQAPCGVFYYYFIF